MGDDHILINGISGEDLIFQRQLIYIIDSVYINSNDLKIKGFNLLIKSQGETITEYHSNSNKLTGEMKIKLNDDPMIEYLIFKDFKIYPLKSKLRIKKQIKINIADWDN